MEEAKMLPDRSGMGRVLPEAKRARSAADWIGEVKTYEKDVLSER